MFHYASIEMNCNSGIPKSIYVVVNLNWPENGQQFTFMLNSMVCFITCTYNTYVHHYQNCNEVGEQFC